MSAQDIKEFPPIRWLVHQVLPEGGLGLLYGPSEIGKSFVALDLAHSIATGQKWLGRATRQGRVVYVAAGEGVPGLHARLNAWEGQRGALTNVGYITEAIQIHQEQPLRKLLATLEPIEPALVVIDTFARCFVGCNENSFEDMSKMTGAADRIRATGAAVLFVHHTGRPDDEGKVHERGHTSLISACDSAMEIEALGEGKDRVLKCRKQKDGDHFYPIYFELLPVKKNGRTVSLVPSTGAQVRAG